MADPSGTRKELIAAIDLALNGNWDRAHKIVQAYDADMNACWIHAVLHKIEGDHANAMYWYRRASKEPESDNDTICQLRAIREALVTRGEANH